MTKITCPKCAGKMVYKMSTGRRRCAQCKYDFFPHPLPLHFTSAGVGGDHPPVSDGAKFELDC